MRKIEFPSATIYENGTLMYKKQMRAGDTVARLAIGNKYFTHIVIEPGRGRAHPPGVLVPILLRNRKRWDAFWKAYN